MSAAGLTLEARAAFYLGRYRKPRAHTFAVTGREGVVCTRATSLERYAQSLFATGWRKGIQADPDAITNNYRRYVRPLVALFEAGGHDGPFLVIDDDNRRAATVPSLAKSRAVEKPGLCLLQPLNAERHFTHVLDVPSYDRPFAAKSDTLVWRGGTAGNFAPDKGPLSPRAKIPALAALRRADIDVGYTAFRPSALRGVDAAARAELEAHRKPGLILPFQLRHRYLLSLEGNDVASGLKWMLASNSVVLMPPPTAVTWACETFLEPFVHYVPVSPDLHDVPERLEWCRANLAACQEITQAAQGFVAALMEPRANAKLAARVARHYAKHVTLVRADDCVVPLCDLPG
ncbi:MAG: glycosyl transferase family 90 [Pseudomonadota bacterium]